MAPKGLSMVLAMVVLTMILQQSLAQQNCTSTITSLAPCLGFLTGNSSLSPSSPCCTQVASLIQTQTQCLCTVLNGAPQLPFVVNQTRALTLPGACKIQTTPLSPCNASVSGQLPPAAVPVSAPASQSTPSVAIAPSPTLPSTPPTANPSTPVAPPSNDSPVNPSSPAPQAATSANGSKTVPTTSQTSSAKISINYAPSLLFLLLVASSVAAF